MITLSRRQAALLVVPLLLVLALAGSRLAATGATTGPETAEPLTAETGGTSEASTARLYVHVVGAVRRAGLYRLPDGSRVADAIRRAGGATSRADVALVNLAAPLADGMQVVVPARLPVVAGGGDPSVVGTAPGKVSLAVATVDQLDELPGVGPVTAEKIVNWRQTHGPFTSVDDLDAIPGIGPARIEQLRDLVTP